MPNSVMHSTQSSSLADILERVLDKGIVIAGDITIALADVELLKIRVRLLVASVDRAEQMGINWWQSDPYLSTTSVDMQQLQESNRLLQQQVAQLQAQIDASAKTSNG